MATKCTWNNWKAQTFQKVHTGCIKYFHEKNKGTPRLLYQKSAKCCPIITISKIKNEVPLDT